MPKIRKEHNFRKMESNLEMNRQLGPKKDCEQGKMRLSLTPHQLFIDQNKLGLANPQSEVLRNIFLFYYIENASLC